MDEKPKGAGSSAAAAIILVLVGLANAGYAAFRFTEGRTDNLPLVVAAVMALTFALILFRRGRS